MGKSKAPSSPTSADLEKAYHTALHRYIDRPTVTGITIGPKVKGGVKGAPAIRIYVEEKFDLGTLSKKEIFPAEIEGVPTDVICRRYSGHQMTDAERRLRRYRVEPLQPGVGISLPGGGSGTLGLIVRQDEAPHQLGILTAAHVVVQSGPALPQIIQPPASDGGKETDKIADLGAFLLPGTLGDAAFGQLTTPRRLNVRPFGLGAAVARIALASSVTVGMVVTKSGMATGVTEGLVETVGTIKYRPAPGSPFVTSKGFEIENKPGVTRRLSRNGDSGAIWVGPNHLGLGLHVAGELHSDPAQGDRAFACFLEDVFRELHLELIPDAEVQTQPRFTNDDMKRV